MDGSHDATVHVFAGFGRGLRGRTRFCWRFGVPIGSVDSEARLKANGPAKRTARLGVGLSSG